EGDGERGPDEWRRARRIVGEAVPRRGPEREVGAGRVADQRNAVEVDRLGLGELAKAVDPCGDVLEAPGPAAAARPDPPELEVPGRVAVRREVVREPVHQVALPPLAPAAAV